MFEEKRINDAYKSAQTMVIDESSKLVIISDCHRGTGGGADHFAQNQLLFHFALDTYYREGFFYIELGDGDELWSNKRMDEIKSEYDRIFELMARMYRENRLLMIYGNHDMVKRKPKWCRNHLSKIHKHVCMPECDLFPGIEVHQSIVLREKRTGNELLLIHGHQADFLNDQLYRLSRFLVRYIWRPLELVGIKNPSSTSLNQKKKDKVEKKLMDWSEKNETAIVAGHTHRPVFPKPGEAPYFNDGSCVHPRYITAIEITGNTIAIVKWEVEALKDGTLGISKKDLLGPVCINSYFDSFRADDSKLQ